MGPKTIKVENVSAAKKVVKTSTTANLTAPNAPKDFEQYLMFDFVNDPVSRDRYHSYTYGGMNFSLKKYWANDTNTTAPTITRGSLSFSPADGTVTTVGVGSHPNNTVKGQWGHKPLHYFTKATDYCQIRFKIDNAVASGTDGTAKFRLDLDCTNDLNPAADVTKNYTRFEKSFKVADVVGKGYVTLSFPLSSDEYLSFDFLAMVHPQFVGLKSESGATAVFNIDYIYIGPQESFPQQEDHLFFDFTDTEEDRQRYDSFTYGHVNFDEASSWITYNGSPISTIRDGALCVAVPTGNTDTSHSVRSLAGFEKSIHYVPGKQDVIQARIQIRNAKATTTDGKVNFCINFDRNNSLTLDDGTSRTWTRVYMPITLSDVVDRGWFTVETTITNWEYLQSEWINLVHPMFQNITNADGKTAEFLIDYIYIGPAEKNPHAYTVTFCAEDGTILEEHTTAKGGNISYTGTTPVKNYDSEKHYSFAGWVDAQGEPAVLNGITESITVYASFKGEAHSYTESVITAPACEAEGVKELSCSCGYSYREAVSPTGHNLDVIKAIPPTCTEEGLSEGTYCMVCNAVVKAPDVIPALGHEAEAVAGYAPGCVTSGLSDGSKCSRCDLVLREQEILPRLGHAMTYMDQGENHIVRCTRCTKESVESHSYEDGLCICGKRENTEPEENPAFKLGHSLNLASDISMNYAIGTATLAGYDMDTVYILAEIDTYKDSEKTGTREIKILPVLNGSYYYFTLDGITAVNMNDEIRAVLYATKDGQVHHSPVDTYSVATYAYAQFTKAAAPQKLKALCAELLRYGSKAQIYKGYRVDSLADAKMTEEQKALLSDMDAVTFQTNNVVLGDLSNPTITWVGKALDLASKVTIKFIFNPGSYTGNIEDLSLHMSYEGVDGKTKSLILEGAELYSASYGFYAFSVDSLLAAELRTVVSAQVYVGETPISATMQYSADTYGNGKTGNLGLLCKALFAYSDSAKRYFNGY